jgi:hypothetical protein
MRLNTSISDRNRILVQVYPPRAFPKLKYSMHVTANNVRCISVKIYWIAAIKMFILYRHW